GRALRPVRGGAHPDLRRARRDQRGPRGVLRARRLPALRRRGAAAAAAGSGRDRGGRGGVPARAGRPSAAHRAAQAPPRPPAAQAMGIHLDRIFALTLALGVGLAGVGGALMAPLFNVYPAVGFPLTIKAFAITILGGMGNLVGALVASLIIGVAESLVVMVVP